MSKDTFPFSAASLRSLRLEQQFQEWEEARQALAHRRAMTRAPLSKAPRLPSKKQSIQTVRAPPAPARCRDTAVHNTFMYGDMQGVYAVLKDPAMVNALMETVQEEMVWTPEMGMWTLSSKVKQTSALRLAASRGHTGCVEELLFRGAEVNADPGGRTALHDACAGGHSLCVQLLLSHGADPNVAAEDGSAPLHVCNTTQSFECAELLLEGGADVNIKTEESKLTPLHVAARCGLERHVELFLSRGADVQAKNREGETPLNAACSGAERTTEAGRYLRVVQTLLDAGADPQTAGRKLHTPLHNACGNCSSRIVEVLLQRGAKADVTNCAGYTPVECLLQVVEDFPSQQPENILRSLLSYGAQPPPLKMLKQCVLSPATVEVMLNSYPSIPSCEWMESVPTKVYERHQDFFDCVREMSEQPRSLQHLCRCALRRKFGATCHTAVSKLNIPTSVKAYLLLCSDGAFK